MAVGDEVAQNLEAQVREAIERMVVDIRSTIQDVREAIDQQLDAALQSVQADANAMSFRSSIQKELATFEGSLTPVPAAPAPEPVKTGEESGRLRESVQTIEKGRSQVDVLNALLDECLRYGSRAALMILKGDTFAGWKGAGFNAHGGNDEAIKRFSAPPRTVPELDDLLSGERVVEWDGGNLASRLGVTAPSRAIAIPMVIKDKVSAAVYVDVTDEEEAERFDPSSLSILVFMTGLLIDTLAIRKKVPSPSLNIGESETKLPVASASAAPAPSLPPTPAPSRPAAPAAPVPATPKIPTAETSGSFRRATAGDSSAVRRPAPATPPPPPAEEPRAAFKPTFQLDTEIAPAAPPTPAPVPSAAPLATTAIPAMHEDTGSVRPAVPPKPASTFGETVDRPSTQYIPPPGVSRGGALGGAQTDDARKHDEARRFARLLVSEIKLYNEAKVEQGRKNHDLYERLKEDIDRSRQMYDERINEDVRKQSNYFYEELVRILADGDSNILGL